MKPFGQGRNRSSVNIESVARNGRAAGFSRSTARTHKAKGVADGQREGRRPRHSLPVLRLQAYARRLLAPVLGPADHASAGVPAVRAADDDVGEGWGLAMAEPGRGVLTVSSNDLFQMIPVV